MEIERKFLTTALPDGALEYPFSLISQTYISITPTIRIRQSDDTYFLTVKGKGAMQRQEFELQITREEYLSLEKKAETPAIQKKRYFLPLEQGLVAEIDIYDGFLEGLITTEVEFASLEEAENFSPPLWMGKDITYDNRYKNVNLAQNGLPIHNP